MARQRQKGKDCIYIYGLYDPRDPEVPRYIGKTKRAISRRLCHHRSDARNGGQLPVNRWVRKLDVEGIAPLIQIEEICDSTTWVEREMAHIAFWRSAPHSRLLNLADGGPGSIGCLHTSEAKAKITDSSRSRTPESWANLVAANRLRWHRMSKEDRQRIRELARQAGKKQWETLSDEEKALKVQYLKESRDYGPLSSEHRRKLSDALKGRQFSEEHRRKISEWHKGKKLTDEHRKKLSDAKKGKKRGEPSEEHRKALSESHKRRLWTPERLALGEQVLARRQEGYTQVEIARCLNLSRSQVRSLLAMMYEVSAA